MYCFSIKYENFPKKVLGKQGSYSFDDFICTYAKNITAVGVREYAKQGDSRRVEGPHRVINLFLIGILFIAALNLYD